MIPDKIIFADAVTDNQATLGLTLNKYCEDGRADELVLTSGNLSVFLFRENDKWQIVVWDDNDNPEHSIEAKHHITI